MSLNFQEMIFRLSSYWADRGVTVLQPYDKEVGAGVLGPAMALPCLGPEPWRAACVQGCRRPADGRYAENPLRLQHHHQFQVVLKPAPPDGRDLFLGSLSALGLDPLKCDLRFEAVEVEFSPLDSTGAGTAVRLSGMEVARIGYLQRMGGCDLDPVSLSIACGLERLALAVTGAADVFDLDWSPNVRYADLYRRREIEFSRYQYEEADPAVLTARFDDAEREARRLLDSRLVLPAYDLLLRCAHVFHLIRARGAGGGSAAADLTGRIRTLARACCKGWIESASLEEMQFHANP